MGRKRKEKAIGKSKCKTRYPNMCKKKVIGKAKKSKQKSKCKKKAIGKSKKKQKNSKIKATPFFPLFFSEKNAKKKQNKCKKNSKTNAKKKQKRSRKKSRKKASDSLHFPLHFFCFSYLHVFRFFLKSDFLQCIFGLLFLFALFLHVFQKADF